MGESLFTSLLHTLDSSTISGIARKLGESETNVSRGMESSIAAVMAGLSAKSNDAGALRKMFDTIPTGSGAWSGAIVDIFTAGSPLLAGGKRILSGLFGSSEGALTSAISHDSGLGTGSVSTIMAMAAPMVMGFLSNKMRDRDMTFSGLGAMLSSESATIRRVLPPTAADLIWRRSDTVKSESPVVAQSVQRESSFPWAALALCALALGCFWLFTHGRHTASAIGSVATGTANRLADGASTAADALKPHVPNIQLKVPDAVGESRLLSFVQDTDAVPSDGTWFDFDRLRFNSGSAKLLPESGEQLDDVAAIFNAYPNLRAKVSGYTDARGSAQANLALSQARADTVRSQLLARGVPAGRLSAEGFGEKNAVGDNSTEAGRAQNRRVSLQVTDK